MIGTTSSQSIISTRYRLACNAVIGFAVAALIACEATPAVAFPLFQQEETSTANQHHKSTKTRAKSRKQNHPATTGATKLHKTQPVVSDDGTTLHGAIDDSAANNTPVVVTPATLLDITSAKFSSLNIDLKDATFLDAKVKNLHLKADNMDMNTGILEGLELGVDLGSFEDFTVDSFTMTTKGPLKFDTNELLNKKILEFAEPINAHVRVVISQSSLNSFLNSEKVLARLSGSAKKRVPILSTLAHKDVNFGFEFKHSSLLLKPDDHLQITMDSKLGIGKMGMPMALSADTRLCLLDGWVNLTDTTLHTSGQMVPKDMSTRIVNRVNSLSKWGSASDDMRFQFTKLKVVPEEQLELEGTAHITRIRLARRQEDEQHPQENSVMMPPNRQTGSSSVSDRSATSAE